MISTGNNKPNKIVHTFGEIKYKPGGKIKSTLGKISAGIMLPVAVLPIAGLFLGIGSAIASNVHGEAWKQLGNIIKFPGDVVFSNLAVLFAIAIAIAFTNDAGPAGFAAFIGWLIFNGIQAALLKTSTFEAVGNQDNLHNKEQFSVVNFLFYKFVLTDSGHATGGLIEHSPLEPVQTFVSSFGGKFNNTFYNGLFSSNCGITSMTTSVFGGVIIGGATAILYNRYHTIQLPTILGFFNGVRFVPIITFLTSAMLGIILSMIWPLVALGLFALGGLLTQAPMSLNVLVETWVQRALVPFGLHHVWYASFWYTQAGGTLNLGAPAGLMIDGSWYNVQGQSGITWYALINSLNGSALPTTYNSSSTIQGDQRVWSFLFSYVCGKQITLTNGTNTITHYLTFADFSTSPWTFWSPHNTPAAVNNPTASVATDGVNVGQYFGWYPMMMFGLPAAGVAMILCANPGEQRKKAASVIISASLTSFLTGITEPIEFTFVFAAPWLFWGLHTTFTAIGGWLMAMLGGHIGVSFSCGVLDYLFYGILPDINHAGAKCWLVPIVGAAMIPLYFFIFTYSIKRYNLQTPGRGTVTKMFTKADFKKQQAEKILEKSGDGTPSNIPQVTVGARKVLLYPMVDKIIELYGGKNNITTVNACITKLRIDVKDVSIPLANKAELVDIALSTGSVAGSNVTPVGQQVQLLMGQIAGRVRDAVKEQLAKLPS